LGGLASLFVFWFSSKFGVPGRIEPSESVHSRSPCRKPSQQRNHDDHDGKHDDTTNFLVLYFVVAVVAVVVSFYLV